MKGYKFGMTRAWEMAKRISLNEQNGGFSNEELIEIFGTADVENIFQGFRANQAYTKIRAWEKKKEEIKIGDIVKVTFPVPRTGIVIAKAEEYIVWFNENLVAGYKESRMKRTGKNVDIQSLFYNKAGKNPNL